MATKTGGPGDLGWVARPAEYGPSGGSCESQFPLIPMAEAAGALADRTFPFDPMVVITPMQMVTIRANMMAYSTAVGPSSRFTNWTTARVN